MATISQQNIGYLHEKITVTLNEEDYLPAFEKSLKEYSKSASLPGFRKGKVPTGLIKKMHGPAIFAEEVLRMADQELINYMQTEQLDILGQPVPLDSEPPKIEIDRQGSYEFNFEIGLRPAIEFPDFSTANVIKYKIDITPEKVENELKIIKKNYAKAVDAEIVTSDENQLGVLFFPCDADGNITEASPIEDELIDVKGLTEAGKAAVMGKKVGDKIVIKLSEIFGAPQIEHFEKRLIPNISDDLEAPPLFLMEIEYISIREDAVLDQELFKTIFPEKEITTIEDFKNIIKDKIAEVDDAKANFQLRIQLHDFLKNETKFELPEKFLYNWINAQNKEAKNTVNEEIVSEEMPTVISRMKWSLIVNTIVKEQGIEVLKGEMKHMALENIYHSLASMGAGGSFDPAAPWINSYADKMLKSQSFVEEAHSNIQIVKVLDWLQTQVTPVETPISEESFMEIKNSHQD